MGDEPVTILRPDGTVDPRLDPDLPREDLQALYRTLLFNRQLDARMLMLQRQGRLGFYMTSTGEEASTIGASYALGQNDWLFISYRELGALLWRGFTLREFLCQLLGNVHDLVKGRQMPVHYAHKARRIASVSSPVGTQLPQAVGLAWAAKIRGDDCVSLAFFGEGTSAQGDCHVAMTFAGVFKAPVIFFCRNNGYAISVPRARQSAAQSLASKGVGYGIEGVQVDGNDILAVIHVVRQAVARARSGAGATLIEALTYRRGAHSSSDDPTVYRSEEEAASWEPYDPIARFQKYLRARGIWTQNWEAALKKDLHDRISRTLEEVEPIPPPPLESMFDDVYAEIPDHLMEQKREYLRDKRGEAM